MAVEIPRQVEERIRELEDAIGLQRGFYQGLLHEGNDWAFLIQLQVIVEAAVTNKVVKLLDQEKAFDHVSRLALDGKTGKLQLALSLGVLDPANADAIRALAACRNRFAHRISSIGSSLDRFGESLDAGTKLDLLRKMGTLQPEDESAARDAGFPEFGAKLRHRLWLSTVVALARLADARLHDQLGQLRRAMEHTPADSLDTSPPMAGTLLEEFFAKSDEGQRPE